MIRSSQYFNNPAFAQAAANLASLFAPPSGADAAGWATAHATRDKAAQLQWLFDNFDDPGASRRAAITGVQTYGATPEGFRYNVDQGNATARYGHDRTFEASTSNNIRDNARALTEREMIESAAMDRLRVTDATSRLGHYLDFGASTSNNIRDNARALTEREMQEAAAMERLGITDATQRYGYDSSANAQRDVARINNAGELQRQYAKPIILDQGQTAHLPRQTAANTELMSILEGAPRPLTADQWQAGQYQDLRERGLLSDEDLVDILFGSQTPVKAIDPETNEPSFMRPGEATRLGAAPYEAATADRVDNYAALGPDGKEMRFPGIVGPDGRIVNANTGEVVPNVIRKEGTGGGISFEADGQGGVRFTTGGASNTVSQQTNLQGQRDAAARSARELQTIFDNISASDVGIAGNVNEFLTNYGAQLFPDVARGDVTAMRTQMQAATMALARSLSGDSRISDSDRRMAQQIMAGQGLGESLPGARAKIAALTVLHAYREKFAGQLAAGGDPLPPINHAVVGELVDDGAISPALAQTYIETMLSSRGGNTQAPTALTGSGQPSGGVLNAPPAGVDPLDWEFMTPEQKALFQ